MKSARASANSRPGLCALLRGGLASFWIVIAPLGVYNRVMRFKKGQIKP